jgi:hypothetical protein
MRWSERGSVAAVLCAVFYCVYIFAICKLPVIGIPTFRIDYSVATLTVLNSNPLAYLLQARPTAQIFVYTQAVLAKLFLDGQCKYIIYPLQHIALLVYFFSLSKVVESVLSVRLSLFTLLGAWVLFAANPGVIEGVYKLETHVGTLSMLFGGLAMVFVARWDRTRKDSSAMTFVLFYVLSILAKEDFILPPLFLLAWYLVRNGDVEKQIATHKVLLITTICVLILFLMFNRFLIVNRSYMTPVNIPGHPYFMTLNPISVARVAFHYVAGVGLHITILNLLFLGTTLTALILGIKQKETLLMTLIVLGMMAPYAIMPNHVFTYYGLKWWALEALMSSALIQIVSDRKAMIVTGLSSAMALLLVSVNNNREMADYFRNAFIVSENLQTSLATNRESINKEPRVGVIGIGPGQITNTPWQRKGETEFFLRDDLHVDTQWILFVTSGDENYTIEQDTDHDSTSRMVVKSIENTKDFGDIPYLVFGPDGHGRFSASSRKVPS